MRDLTGAILAGRYRVINYVGGGGMADVYKVWDNQRAALLAMKVLREDYAEDLIFLRQFRKEADTLKRLDHPNIVRFYELVETDDLTFYLMDFIEGSTLRSEIAKRKAPFPAPRILEIFRPVCAALYYAHELGIFHCDVKPANIMVEAASGKVLLADFGIARLAGTSTTATAMATAGTSAYMAPEQVLGQKPVAATDLYALGVILFELLTGFERPFTGTAATINGNTDQRVRWEQVNLPPPSPRAFNPSVSPELEAVVLRCLEKDPARRFPNAMALLSTLEQALAGWAATAAQTAPPFEATRQGMPGQPGGLPVTTPYPQSQWPGQGPLPATTPYPQSQWPGQPPQPPYPPQDYPSPPVPRRSRPWWVYALGLGGLLAISFFVIQIFPPPEPTVIPNITVTSRSVTIDLTEPTNTFTLTPTRLTPTLTPTITRAITATRSPIPSRTPTTVANCTSIGQTFYREKDKAEMVCVPAGSFTMGYPNCRESWCQDEIPQAQVNVGAFWIDRSEITNEQFQRFVADTNFTTGPENTGASEVWGVEKPVAGANWRSPQGPGSSINGRADHPVVQMNWFSANAYCQWAGGRLPTEAQWEKAARGTAGYIYPWGANIPDETLLNYDSPSNRDGFKYTSPVGRFPAGDSPYGLHDMAGNAYEWTRSLNRSYPYNPSDGREISGQPANTDEIVARGGSFYTDWGTVRSTRRYAVPAQRANDGFGFRCVIDR